MCIVRLSLVRAVAVTDLVAMMAVAMTPMEVANMTV